MIFQSREELFFLSVDLPSFDLKIWKGRGEWKCCPLFLYLILIVTLECPPPQ